jgi:diguanylate cyclase (GGDEF)-like protein
MKKILIIENLPTLREEILRIVDELDLQGIGAENGVRGLELAQQFLPDLIISDVMVSELDGYGVLKALQQNPATAAIPFIFLSAKANRSDIREGMNRGADDYLTKPFTVADLKEAIHTRLAKQATVTQPYIDEMKRAAAQLNLLAYRDPLTNLPNRTLLYHQLRVMLNEANRRQRSIALLCLCVDRFKSINLIQGYEVGDVLLQQVAARLSACVGKDNMVARLGIDEFGVVLNDIADSAEVIAQTERILQALSGGYAIDHYQLSAEFSIGVTLYPEDNSSAEKLLDHADLAMCAAKQQPQSAYQFYNPSMDTQLTERQQLISDLGQALERNELYLLYQPQVNLVTGRIIGVEALVRWRHATRGVISPVTFIPLAEETGLIVPIGDWVLHTACAQAKEWQAAHAFPIRVAVNLSARQFKQQHLVAKITEVLATTGLTPTSLGLELTETSVMEDGEATIATLRQLKAMGIQISVDDFGTGYSSLNYLRRYPLDSLKIDKSFVQDITEDSSGTAIATAILAMAQSLKLKVIAEGVETEAQLNFLRQRGCYAMQGFLFSRPIAPDEVDKMLATGQRLNLSTPR